MTNAEKHVVYSSNSEIMIINSLFIESYTCGPHWHIKINIVTYSLYKSYTQEAKHSSKYI